ncbi:MAG: polyprenol monophosphomannose synthase [Acidimicrobiales bacterium]
MRTVVVVPTYQEADNVGPFLAAVRASVPDAEVLVVDDNSPDGTGEIAEKVGAELGQITVLHRPGKEGLGVAYRDGFGWALRQGFDVVVQMDCDFSHDPAVIPQLVARLDEAGVDCAIGSRYVPGGSTPNWPLHRRLLSRWGNRYTSAMLQLGINDATGGFRAYRAATLRTIHVETTTSNGYAFMSELAHRMVAAGLHMVEVPITFVDRAYGTSKMSVRIMTESMAMVTGWGTRARLARRRSAPTPG